MENTKIEDCLTAALNAPSDMMRSWGVEILGMSAPETVARVAEWIIANAEEIAEIDHQNFFRVLHNLDVSVDPSILVKGLLSERIEVRSIAIGCVDAGNFSDEIREVLEQVGSKIPFEWGYLNDRIEKIIESEGHYKRF